MPLHYGSGSPTATGDCLHITDALERDIVIIGSRMAGRACGFDHGLKYFTIRDPEFREALTPLVGAKGRPWRLEARSTAAGGKRRRLLPSRTAAVGAPVCRTLWGAVRGLSREQPYVLPRWARLCDMGGHARTRPLNDPSAATRTRSDRAEPC